MKQRAFLTALVLALSAVAAGAGEQASPPTPQSPPALLPPPGNPDSSPAAPPLFDFKDSDIKFSLSALMSVLRDQQHEGWVLAAYPDPKTSRPLIGAGFSLDVLATEHPQLDILNPHPFLEPSSAQLWQAAGLEPDRLQAILVRFNRDLQSWTKKRYRRKIKEHTLPPDLTEAEAIRLLRISAIQAIHNARAYCRDFDRLTASQQMALSQLVFQMGVNLEEFVQFLSAINGDIAESPSSDSPAEPAADRWKTVQQSLIDSQWARRYTTRATTVIAMFDPDYHQNPKEAERRVEAVLHPPAKHRRKKTPSRSLRAAVDSSHSAKVAAKKRNAQKPNTG